MDWTKLSLRITLMTFLLSFFGLAMVANSSLFSSKEKLGDEWYFIREQSISLTVGVVAFLVAANLPLTKLIKYFKYFFYPSLILLIMVLIPGIGISLLGARRWISIMGFSFQPSEAVKLFTILYLSSISSADPKKTHKYISYMVITALLIMLQPDLGTTLVVVGICFFSYLAVNKEIKNILVLGLGVFLCGGILAVISPYRMERLKSFIDISHDPLGKSYQIRQSILGIGSGGIFGVGLGASKQKYEFLPEVATDSIFSVIAEETGFIGVVMLIVAYLYLIKLGLEVAKNAQKQELKITALGISSLFGLQAFLNISASVALVPFTGVPLAFISYGGTSLISMMTASGLLVNISRKRNET